VNTRLLIAGGAAALVAAFVSSQSGLSTVLGASPAARSVASAVAPARSAESRVQPQVVAAQARPAAAATTVNARALLDKYCVTCHNARTKTANLLLDELDVTHLADHAEIAETVVRKMRAGLMPPTNMPRPDAATFESLMRWMEDELDTGAHPHLPAPGLHRLNRTEYANAIRDLLALEVDSSKFLPVDDSTHGFDNIAGALTMSPALMEAYLSAAGKISRLAIGTVDGAMQWVWDVPSDTAQNHHIEGLPFGTRGGIRFEHTFPADGEYAFNVKGVTGYFQRRRARASVRLGQGDFEHDGQWQVDATHSRHRRPPRRGCDVHRHQRRTGDGAEQAIPADHEHAGEYPGLHLLPARRAGDHRGTAQREGRDDDGQPRAHLRVPPGRAS
jgi:cytochrome c5